MPERPSPSIAGRSDMNRLTRHVSSHVIRALIDPRLRWTRSALSETARRLRGAPHRIDYFHQVGDPYSQLAVQALTPLLERYEIEIVPHVSAFDTSPNQPEPELLDALARRDCASVAPHYGLSFPSDAAAPEASSVRALEQVLVAAARHDPESFAAKASRLGDALWRGDAEALREGQRGLARASDAETQAATREACALRERMGHYSGATFHYAGEWYWGVDRLHHLERRLRALGVSRASHDGLRFPRPAIEMAPVPGADELTLEVFPSLRSPYTAIAFEPTLTLARRTGVELVVRPVLPMVMRGVPVTFAKGIYIMSDTLRESAALDIPFGRILDPIGEPVRRAYSLWPWARKEGRGESYLASFLRAAFCDGIDTSVDAGLRRVVERAGLSWDAALAHLGDPTWEAELESNRRAMIDEMGQWGVPSYRLRGPTGTPDLHCWGQDRLWLVAREIQARGRP